MLQILGNHGFRLALSHKADKAPGIKGLGFRSKGTGEVEYN